MTKPAVFILKQKRNYFPWLQFQCSNQLLLGQVNSFEWKEILRFILNVNVCIKNDHKWHRMKWLNLKSTLKKLLNNVLRREKDSKFEKLSCVTKLCKIILCPKNRFPKIILVLVVSHLNDRSEIEKQTYTFGTVFFITIHTNIHKHARKHPPPKHGPMIE